MVNRAGTLASSASRAEDAPEFIDVIPEFMLNSLAVSLELEFAGIVSGCVQREQLALAIVPILDTSAAFDITLIDDIKAMAGRAEERACAASDAGYRSLFPERVIEIRRKPAVHRFMIELGIEVRLQFIDG